MPIEGNLTYYDVLDLTPDASAAEIRQAYSRAKGTYTRDNAALYTMVDPEERDSILHQIEEAYLTLSDPVKRKDYDQLHGLLTLSNEPGPAPGTFHVLESTDSASPEDMLVSPTTDFEDATQSPPTAPLPLKIVPPPAPPTPPAFSVVPPPPAADPDPIQEAPLIAERPKRTEIPATPPIEPWLAREIEVEAVWKGSFLKKVRETLRISIEEMSAFTKISKTYVTAIEEEAYTKLPASVFVRGFVTQMAKALKLPLPESVATAYLKRLKEARSEK